MRASKRAGDNEGGFALILAILALMLLTTMGITLSLTTSTELQIANNYKWSQQALYNAEAGMEAGKRLLQNMDWSLILPAPRGGEWPASPINVSPPTPIVTNSRNFQNGECDGIGRGQGYGVVLSNLGTTYENVDTVWGQSLRGAFTLWVRRETVFNQNGSYSDSSANDNTLILTSEGVAPYTTNAGASVFAQANRAVRVMEWKLSRTLRQCGARSGQAGGGPEGGGPGACKGADNDTMDKTMTDLAAAGGGGMGGGDQIDAAAN